jgi:EAL domain-containing protein (putative c-di-GMP-specific phosphodiesterase class I)
MTTLPTLDSSRIRFAAIWLAIVASTMTVPVAKTMKNLLYTILAAGALASPALGLAASANAAPSGPSVDATVNQLRAQGFKVIVNRVGTAAADRCTLNAVRPGQTFSRIDSGVPGADNDIVTTVTTQTVYVDVTC